MASERQESPDSKSDSQNGDNDTKPKPHVPFTATATVDLPKEQPCGDGLKETASGHDANYLPEPDKWPSNRHLNIELFFGFCLLIFTGGQAVFAWRQWAAMNEQLGVMSRQFTEMQSQTAQAKATAKAASDSVAEAKRANDTAADAAKAAKDSVAEAQRANATAEKAADAAIESNTIANGAAEKQLRAYVTLTSACALQYTPRKFRASLTVKNAGQTPAYKVMSKSTAIFKPKTYSGKFDLSQETYTNGKEMTSGPGREWTINVDYNLQKTDEPGFNAHTSVIWVFGQIVYVDAFGNERFTNFRFKQGEVISVSTKQQGRGTVTDGFGCALLFTDEGNDSN